MRWQERAGVRWLEARLPGATTAFTSRLGGVSEPPFDSLNLGLLTEDDRNAVRENRARAVGALGRDARGVLIGYQVHADAILARDVAPDPNPYLDGGGSPPPADGQATASPALTPVVQVADCLPIALTGDRGVAMLHCGWRGLADGIIARGVEAVGALAAAIGPGIGPCCYRVGSEVVERFAHLGGEVASDGMLDLTGVARRQLSLAGVREVEAAGLCTSCETDLFFSHRRDGPRTGRQGAFVWRDPERGSGA